MADAAVADIITADFITDISQCRLLYHYSGNHALLQQMFLQQITVQAAKGQTHNNSLLGLALQDGHGKTSSTVQFCCSIVAWNTKHRSKQVLPNAKYQRTGSCRLLK